MHFQTFLSLNLQHIVTMKLIILAACIALASAQEAYQNQARDFHNSYRKKHQAGPMTLDTTMNANAVKCAQYYANKKTIDHSCPYKNGAGENLMGGSVNWSKEQSAKGATDMWYNEVKMYNYNKPGFTPQTGHFTQLVWKSSTKLGFGAVTTNGYTAAVALYSPAGNIVGNNNQYFRDNVLPPK